MAGRAARTWLGVALFAALAWFFVGGIPGPAAAAASDESAQPVTLVLFHGDGCPHCAAERKFLKGLAERHPDLVIEQYEVWYDEANRARLEETAERLGFEPTGVPVTVIGERVWIGFDDARAEAIEETVVAALEGDAEALEPQTSTTLDAGFLGTIDLGDSSLLVSTLVIGFVDGVNPCSLWVLSVLLAIVLHSGSRGRVILVGTTFLFVTTAMYALYIVGFYSALDYVGEMVWIRLGLAAIAITFGVLQLKDGLYPGVGPSLSISADRKPGLYKRMRAVASADRSLPAVIAGTVALAVGVSLLETPCTAGLPLLWTSLLADAGVSTATAAGLFSIYMAVFLLDELIVFGVAVFTLRAAKLQERHGRLLKLIAGSVLLTLGLTMLFAPQAMDTLTGTMVVFGVAALLTLALWLFAVRPRRATRAPV